MKLILPFLLITFHSLAQTTPQVIYATPDFVQGIASKGSTINISKNGDKVEHSLKVDEKGIFEQAFSPPLNIGENIVIWSVDSKGVISQKLFVQIENPSSYISSLTNSNILNKNFTNYDVAGRTIKYKATIWNTNFSIPLARFNFTENDDHSKGNLLLFNSIGAGFGISGGELNETRDMQGDLINQEFINTLGVHLGFLFSAGTGDDAKNVFAPTLNMTVLDFQLGFGYELGTLSENQKPLFLTLSYAIPMYKLKKGGFWIWKSATPITSPLESRLGE